MYKKKVSPPISTAAAQTANLLQTEGINCKGYGLVPKAVMLDTELSLYAKAIYAYFCSLAGNGTTVFPSRDTILDTLQMSKDGYYKHIRQLQEQGYIRVERTNTFPSRAIYTLVANPKKLDEQNIVDSNHPYANRLSTQGIKKYGFGFIPRLVMGDPRLTPQAKAIYAYFCSWAGAGCVVFPSQKQFLQHLGITRKTYYKHLRLLLDCNYLQTEQRRDKKGVFAVTNYYLVEMPWQPPKKEMPMTTLQDNQPVDTLQDNHANGLTEPSVPVDTLQDNHTNGLTEPSVPVDTLQDNHCFPVGKLQDDSYSITSNNISTSINLSISAKKYNYSKGTSNLMDEMDNKKIIEQVKCNIEYDLFQEDTKRIANQYIKCIFDVMLEAICTTKPTVRIGGQELPQAVVAERLLQVESDHVEYVCDCLQRSKKSIRNLRSYLLTSLYRAPVSMEAYYAREIEQQRLA